MALARMTPVPSPKTTSDRLTTVLSYGTLLLLLYLVYRFTEPFFVPLAWSAVLAIFFYPLHERIEERMKPTLAALLSTVGVTLVLIAPDRGADSGDSAGDCRDREDLNRADGSRPSATD